MNVPFYVDDICWLRLLDDPVDLFDELFRVHIEV